MVAFKLRNSGKSAADTRTGKAMRSDLFLTIAVETRLRKLINRCETDGIKSRAATASIRQLPWAGNHLPKLNPHKCLTPSRLAAAKSRRITDADRYGSRRDLSVFIVPDS